MMKIIPLIYMKNRKIHIGEAQNPVTLKEFLKQVENEDKIYILDLDGIEKDEPNLCTYQRLPDSYELWVDFGPRNLGDIMDATMAGATDITLRKKLCPQLQISEIKEITENNIYETVDIAESFSMYDVDGLINFNSREKIEADFKFEAILKQKLPKSKIYSYESDLKNRPYWESFNISGLLVDIDKLKEFKDAV